VVYVEVRETQVIDLAQLGRAQLVRAAIAAVEQEPRLRLAGINLNEQRVVAPRLAENLEGKGHGAFVVLILWLIPWFAGAGPERGRSIGVFVAFAYGPGAFAALLLPETRGDPRDTDTEKAQDQAT